MTRVLITGATGYVGSRLVKHLVGLGTYDVSLLTRPSSDLAILGGAVDPSRVHPTTANVEELVAILNAERPDVVVHLASLFLAQHEPEEVVPLVTANIAFGSCLLEAMAQTGVTRFINTGTAWETMDGPPAYRPVCLYAATKRAFEDILRYYQDAQGVSSITLKLYDTYGPNDPRPKLFALLRKSLSLTEPIPFSAGEQVLDLVHIDDVVRAYESAIELLCRHDGALCEDVFIGSGHGRSLKEVIQVFSDAVGQAPNIALGERPYRPREVMFAEADVTPARDLLGWEPRIGLEEGIRSLYFGGQDD